MQARLGERGGRIGVDGVEHLGGTEPFQQRLRPARPDVADAAQVAEHRLGVVGGQGVGLGDLDLAAEAAVLDPFADDPGALALLEVDERSDEGDRRAVGPGGIEHRPAGLLVGEADVADGDRRVEAHGTTVEPMAAPPSPPAGPRPAAPAQPTLADVRAAADRLRGVAHRTPALRSRTLDERLGAQVWLKAETLQRVGAFKFRGAYNAIAALEPAARARGITAASSGNHAQAVALASRLCGTRATILMPRDAPANKRAATEAYGAEVIEFDRYAEDREALLTQLAADRDLEIVHPFDNLRVMAGQGTAALELIEQAGELDALVVPVGGGGLISGCAVALAGLAPGARVYGVEPEASDDVMRSLASGRPERVAVGPTIADGQQTPTPGRLTWPVIHALVEAVVTVSDAEILAAMRFCFERLKLVVEPSGATGLAALLAGRLELGGARVGVILSGGNADPAVFARALH